MSDDNQPMSNRYALTPAWHVIDTHDQTEPGMGGREMAAAMSAAEGERIVAALNASQGAEKMRAGLERCCEESDYCYACDNHPSHGHAGDCPLRSGDG